MVDRLIQKPVFGDRCTYPYGIDRVLDFDIRLSETALRNPSFLKSNEIKNRVQEIQGAKLAIQDALMSKH